MNAQERNLRDQHTFSTTARQRAKHRRRFCRLLVWVGDNVDGGTACVKITSNPDAAERWKPVVTNVPLSIFFARRVTYGLSRDKESSL